LFSVELSETSHRQTERERLSARGTATAAINRRRDTQKRVSHRTLDAIMAETEQYLERCAELEMQLDLSMRWTQDCEDYKAAKKYSDERQYHIAAMDVKVLVTQRLMEMAKCHMQGTSMLIIV
jgi:hypothetical protein